MGYISKTLFGDEKIVYNVKTHPIWFISTFPAIILPFFGPFWSLFFKEMAVTSKRVICKTGIISRKTNEMLISKIETVEMKQSILGRIFGYSVIKITGTGVSDVILKDVSSPFEVKKAIENQL